MRRKLIGLAAAAGLHLKLKPFKLRRTARVGPRLGKVRSMLDPRLRAPVVIEYHEPDSELFRRFKASKDVHKWHHYFEVYSRRLEPLRQRPIRMLEIGVFRGGSLDMWKGWFHPESVIVGLDIDSECQQYEKADQGIHVRIGDQCDGEFLSRVVEEFGPFDLILDDGGHTTTQMIASFNHLFRDGLAVGGLYLVEDTHTNFWPGHVDSPMTFIEFCKGMVELIHAPYFGAWSVDPYEFRGSGETQTLEMSWLEAWLHSVTFYDSIVCIEKRRRTIPVHELR